MKADKENKELKSFTEQKEELQHLSKEMQVIKVVNRETKNFRSFNMPAFDDQIEE